MRRLGDRPDGADRGAPRRPGGVRLPRRRTRCDYVGDTLGVPHSRVYGVATFYSFFTLKPQGEHTCVVCTGTACYINGAKEILAGLDEAARRQAQARRPRTARSRCSPPAASAPAAWRRPSIVDGEVKGKVDAGELDRPAGGDVSEHARRGAAHPPPRHHGRASTRAPSRASAYVCEAASCMSAQAHDITAPPRRARSPRPASTDVVVKRVGCLGLCAAGPLVEIPETGQLFEHVTPDDVGADRRRRSRRSSPTDERAAAGPVLREAAPGRDRELRAASTPRASTTTSSAAATRPCAASSPR